MAFRSTSQTETHMLTTLNPTVYLVTETGFEPLGTRPLWVLYNSKRIAVAHRYHLHLVLPCNETEVAISGAPSRKHKKRQGRMLRQSELIEIKEVEDHLKVENLAPEAATGKLITATKTKQMLLKAGLDLRQAEDAVRDAKKRAKAEGKQLSYIYLQLINEVSAAQKAQNKPASAKSKSAEKEKLQNLVERCLRMLTGFGLSETDASQLILDTLQTSLEVGRSATAPNHRSNGADADKAASPTITRKQAKEQLTALGLDEREINTILREALDGIDTKKNKDKASKALADVIARQTARIADYKILSKAMEEAGTLALDRDVVNVMLKVKHDDATTSRIMGIFDNEIFPMLTSTNKAYVDLTEP